MPGSFEQCNKASRYTQGGKFFVSWVTGRSISFSKMSGTSKFSDQNVGIHTRSQHRSYYKPLGTYLEPMGNRWNTGKISSETLETLQNTDHNMNS